MDSRSAEYISHYISDERDIKNISVELIVKTAGLIERMGKKIIPPKKHKKHKRKSWMATLEQAIEIAVEAHKGQVDKAGVPYVMLTIPFQRL